jgi:Bacterial PH domain
VSEAAPPSVQRVIFRVPVTGLLPLGLLAICESPVVASTSAVFALLYLIPIVGAVWILRTRTVVDSEQLRTRTLFGARTLAWGDIRSLKLPRRGWVNAVLAGDELVPLPGVRTRHLPMLAALSGGRLSDPDATAQDAE